MFKIVIYLTTLTSILVLGDEEVSRKPLYKYRYETEDLMKTAASSVPIHGYHVVEGGYYPSEAGFSGGFGGGGISSGGFGGYGGQYIGGKLGPVGIGGGYGPGFIGGGGGGIGAGGIGGGQFIGSGIGSSKFIGGGIGGGQFIGGAGGGQFIGGGGAGLGGHGYGGEIIDKNVYSGEKKNLNDEQYEKASGKKGEEINHGQEGYSQGKVAVKDIKGDNGYYSDVEGGKKVIEDGKSYHGGQHFNQEGKNGGEKKNKQGHKKGHVIKGFKTSHHKDETGKTEEFYDEENDEGDNYNYNGQSGSFGENGASQFKGGHEDGKFNSGESKKEGHYDNEHILDKSNADHGKYGENKYAGSGAVYGVNNGVDQQSLLGHQENSRFYKHHPHYVPFYHY